jgi:hypothetical protein
MAKYTAISFPRTASIAHCPQCQARIQRKAIHPSAHFDPTLSAVLDHVLVIQAELADMKRLLEEGMQP